MELQKSLNVKNEFCMISGYHAITKVKMYKTCQVTPTAPSVMSKCHSMTDKIQRVFADILAFLFKINLKLQVLHKLIIKLFYEKCSILTDQTLELLNRFFKNIFIITTMIHYCNCFWKFFLNSWKRAHNFHFHKFFFATSL